MTVKSANVCQIFPAEVAKPTILGSKTVSIRPNMATTDHGEEHQPDVSVAPLSLSTSSPTTASAATMSAESPSTESPAVPTIDTEILVSELVFYTVKAEAVEAIWADFPARYHSVKTLAVMLKRKASENEIKAEYWYDLQRLIWAFFNVEDLKVL